MQLVMPSWLSHACALQVQRPWLQGCLAVYLLMPYANVSADVLTPCSAPSQAPYDHSDLFHTTSCNTVMQVHLHLVEWSQDLHQLKSIMDTLEEEEQLMAQSLSALAPEPHSSTAVQGNGAASENKTLQDLTAQISEKTENALSASTQTPSDGLELLEGIAELSKQMVGEAKEDVALFNRASAVVPENSK